MHKKRLFCTFARQIAFSYDTRGWGYSLSRIAGSNCRKNLPNNPQVYLSQDILLCGYSVARLGRDKQEKNLFNVRSASESAFSQDLPFRSTHRAGARKRQQKRTYRTPTNWARCLYTHRSRFTRTRRAGASDCLGKRTYPKPAVCIATHCTHTQRGCPSLGSWRQALPLGACH